MYKVLIAMSGGVDSSVTAYLIRKSGTDCVGATLKLVSEEFLLDTQKSCCSVSDAEAAREVAVKLGMEHYLFPMCDGFREKVIDRFVSAYENGGTPNPCIDCNRYMKFGKLIEKAELLGCDRIATGHYARVGYDEKVGRWILKKAADDKKDQSYVLWTLRQHQLSRILFPLGEMTKPKVREIAAEQGFINADKPDSQDICFVPNGDYAKFISQYTGKTPVVGDFIMNGKTVGRHKGIIYYTVGQRKKLGIALGYKVCVTDIDALNNTVTLGDEPNLYRNTLEAHDINLISVERITEPMHVTAKIRYAHAGASAVAEQIDGDTIRVSFDEPQRAITRGQSVVLYDGDTVVGGGVIA